MKRVWIIILCFSLFVSGCVTKPEQTQEADTDRKKEVEQTQDTKAPSLEMIQDIPSLDVTINEKPQLSFVEFEANVMPYTVGSNLANIENISQFSGFTDEQKRMLAKNGFVVLPSKDTKMYFVYDDNEYRGIPNFITSDSVLHAFHLFYDNSLFHIESNYMYEDLDLLTSQMLEKSIQLYHALEDEQLRKLQEKNIIYFFVAKMLMDSSYTVKGEISDEVVNIALNELKLIEAAEGYMNSPLFGFDIDYSQFKVRGHYTKTEQLGKFFQTMMWFGTAPLPFFDEQGVYLYDHVLQALLITFTTFMQSEKVSDAQLWANIYVPTGQYVGLSDDIHVFTMNELRTSVFSEGNDPNVFNDEKYYTSLLEAVKTLPDPKIQAKYSEYTDVDTPTGKQFRFMGQRYILDSYIMQQLMEPILRPIPSGFDVMGVLGSEVVEHLLFTEIMPQKIWRPFEQIYQNLEQMVGEYSEEFWQSNLYNGWLWVLQSALTEFTPDSGMPMFMTNDAWRKKMLNTALGSYTELKHDTVLYGKQPAAEMGGPLDFPEQKHYVEPNVPLYSKLYYLTDYTLAVLKERGMLQEDIETGANLLKDLLKLLIDVSIKELRNEPLSKEENDRLLRYGGTLEYISHSLIYGGTGNLETIMLSDMLVSDIATIIPNTFDDGAYFTMGTGYFDHIYVVVPIEGKLYLTRGSVFSYYEFLSETRLTDEEWWALHGLNKVSEEWGSYYVLEEPSPNLPSQPFWIKDFKSAPNNVVVEMPEVDWEKLND